MGDKKGITRRELIKRYLDFFKSKGHAIIPSASLIPENDPTVLFTTAGMHPLVPFLLGEKHPLGKRLASVQKCLRTGDIDDVGDEHHHTFFEMLGNWSLGDYFKKEAIEMSFEFLTKELKIPKNKIAVSVFLGDKDAPKDDLSAGIWIELGIPISRIAFLPKESNWWGPAGKTGPCGPCSEMFYFIGGRLGKDSNPETQPEEWREIWNDVFMEYNKTGEEDYASLKQKNVDTGMGVERTIAILNGQGDDYLTDSFLDAIKKIEEITGRHYGKNESDRRAMRIIADHIKAACFLLAERILPSNVERGYVLRRIIRRAVRYGKILGMHKNFTKEVAFVFIEMYGEDYTELKNNREFILDEIDKEESRFRATLESGLKEFARIANRKIRENESEISGEDAFLLYQSFGFPIEMTQELGKERGLGVDIGGYNKEYEKHQDLSRTASQGRFASGLADTSERTTRLHTATHLLHAALRKVLGSNVQQKGSNITTERLRFDFSFDRKMSNEEITKVENMVNDIISKGLPVLREEMSPDEAKTSGALGFFEKKYGERVSVYTAGTATDYFSKEICTGPHVSNTKEIGKFKILKEEAVAAGVRRIKAVVE